MLAAVAGPPSPVPLPTLTPHMPAMRATGAAAPLLPPPCTAPVTTRTTCAPASDTYSLSLGAW